MKNFIPTRMSRFLFLVVFSLFQVGCYYDNIERKYNQSGCDLTSISWTSDVKPLVDQFCIACHQGSSPAAGLLLEGYQDVKASVLQGEFSLYRLPSGVSILMKKNKGYVIESYRRLFLIVKEFKNIAGLNRFLLGFFFASAGVQTVILIASLFGTKVLGLDSSSLIMTILLIQFVAILGSWSFAKLSDRFGNIRSLILACLLWIMICILAFFVNSPLQFYFLGSAVGLVMGGLQSLGRSTFSKMLPPEDEHVTYFSFFDIAEKLATVLGMVAVGWVETVTGNLRLSPLVLSIFFMIAVFLWFGVNKFYRSQKNFG
jgi:UMF1 family MFS transporter